MALPDRHDRWYSGTGATAFKGNYFGYSGRLSGMATSLGTRIEVGGEVAIWKRWTMRAAFGVVDAGEVVRRSFARDRLTVLSLESTLRF